MYLSRIDPTVFPYSQVAYINCSMGPHIIAEGWLLNNANTAPNVQFWEYRSTDLKGAALDVSKRSPFSRQLTASEAAQWSNPSFVLGGWVPATLNSVVTRPGEAVLAKWTAPEDRAAGAWIGLYSADGALMGRRPLGAGVSGEVNFDLALKQYELRLFVGGDEALRRVAVGR